METNVYISTHILIITFIFFLRDFIFKKTLFEKLQDNKYDNDNDNNYNVICIHVTLCICILFDVNIY